MTLLNKRASGLVSIQEVIEKIDDTPFFENIMPPSNDWLVFDTLYAAHRATHNARSHEVNMRTKEVWDWVYYMVSQSPYRNWNRDITGLVSHKIDNLAVTIMNKINGVTPRWFHSYSIVDAFRRDALLYVSAMTVIDSLDEAILKYIQGRWDVWQYGYGIYVETSGTLNVYKKI